LLSYKTSIRYLNYRVVKNIVATTIFRFLSVQYRLYILDFSDIYYILVHKDLGMTVTHNGSSARNLKYCTINARI